MNIRNLKKVLLLGIGFIFLVIGLVGILLPIMPGLPFLFIGATFCARASGRIKRLIKLDQYIAKIKMLKFKHPSFANFFLIKWL